jgi:hypothetical protein
MTKIEELKAALDAAFDAWEAAGDAADAAAYYDAWDAYLDVRNDAACAADWAAYKAEIKKQEENSND